MVLFKRQLRVPVVGWLILILIAWRAAVAKAWGVPTRPEMEVLLDVKAALDPHGEVLKSWQAGWQPCTNGAFEGVLCDAGDNNNNKTYLQLSIEL